MKVYLFEAEQCNGEYGEVDQRSIHTTLEEAKARAKIIPSKDPEDKAEYYNEWAVYYDEGDHLVLNTGTWGYTVYHIYTLELKGIK